MENAAPSSEENKGLSKKEMNKLARKEKRSSASTTPSDNLPVAYTISIAKDPALAPVLTRAVELLVGNEIPKVRYVHYLDAKKSMPSLNSAEENANKLGSISGDINVARYLVKSSSSASHLYCGRNKEDHWTSAQVDSFLELASLSAVSADYPIADLLDTYLSSRTYLVGHEFSLADIAMALAIKKTQTKVNESSHPHCHRWLQLVTSLLPDMSQPIPVTFVAPAKSAVSTRDTKQSSNTEKQQSNPSNNDNAAIEDGGSCPPLENAVEGQVCTRFPPEPSGYLHIGHAKAVLLNQYYASRYNGRLLVRFDDTNPSKEKEEFEENILHDLATLGVKADKVSHSSDHFKTLENYARQMINEGKAYMDNTDQETMQAERLKMIDSKCRSTPPEENLRIFEELVKGTKEYQTYCLRAKIDMQSVNGTMRDPVLFRFNATPHHRTGSTFKAYPTYDFACPIIDSIEGVSHALRTTEYNDRDEQYHWIQEALGLRRVYIQAFGKMNFVNTVLSKRKLTWFVEQKLVEGWFDARFPTIQGCVRRGVNVEALKNFIISQGASRRVITMEWDKFWAENKKVLEEKSPRYMGVSPTHDLAVMVIENVPEGVTFHTVQLHPQKPEMGNRVMRRSNRLLLDQCDALTYAVGEEVTLVRWGNMKITHIEKSADGKRVMEIRAVYDETATNFSKTKKATWLADVPENIACRMVEFDHLISKAKLGDEEDFKDFINPVTRVESDGLVDACIRLLPEGSVIQLERKGFFRIDRAYGGSPDKPVVLFAIPDGRAKTLNPNTAANASAGKGGETSKKGKK